MKRLWIIVVGCIVAFLVIRSASAQDSLRGVVTDVQNGTPLVGAHVMLQSNWRMGTTTDADGTFLLQIADLQETDSIIFSFVGFREEVIAISEISNNDQILLTPNSREFEAIEIAADRLISEEFSVRKITKMEVYTNPSAKADVLLAVNATPSSTTVDESANVSFRGSSPMETSIFLNGVPIYDAVRYGQLNGIGTFSFFNTEMIDNILVFPGNPPLEFGNTSSGLIALETSDQIPLKSFTSIILSPANMGLSYRRRIKKSGMITYMNYQPSRLLKGLNPRTLEDIDQFGSLDAGFHISSNIGAMHSIKVFNYVLRESYDYNFSSPSYRGNFSQEKFKDLTTIQWIWNTGKGKVTANSGYAYTAMDFAFSEARYNINSHDFYTSFNYQIEGRQHGMKTGISYDGRFQNFEGLLPEFGYALSPDHPFQTSRYNLSREILDAYLYYKYSPTDKLTVGLAVRKNIPFRDGQKDVISWQGNLSYDVTQSNVIKFAFGNFNKYLLTQEGQIEFFKTSQYSIDYQFQKENLQFSSSLFHKKTELKDEERKVYGVEFYSKINLGDHWTFDFGYTGLNASVHSDGLTYSSLYDLDYFMRGGIKWEFAGLWTIGTRYLFRQGTYFQPVIDASFDNDLNVFVPVYASLDNQARYRGYNLVDVNVSRLVAVRDRIGLIIFASVSNIFDFKNIRTYEYSSDYSSRNASYFNRRTFYFGVVINFQ